MNLIEKTAKQEDNPCLLCTYKCLCPPEVRTKCNLTKKWREFRHEAYREHLAWCVKMLSFKKEG